ncbi:MAG: molybdopterin cofactor-binding domain-containing protein [Candidatus Neomarinimicrobiota bacterium]
MMKIVGRKTARIDGLALAKGKAVFADDIFQKDILYAKFLFSPVAHANIKSINIKQALALKGVAAVLTYKDFPVKYYTTAGQGYPEPSPKDYRIFDGKVRYAGDRVAVAAAETLEIAEAALKLIKVEYEKLPANFDLEKAIGSKVVLHPEKGKSFIFNARRNISANIEAEVGNVDKGLKESKYVFTQRYFTPYVQQAAIEPHITRTWLDENDRLIIRTATQVPFHVRRIVAEVLDIPVRKIRVIKPRIGGGFGGKQEILNEEVCAALTLKTGRPVRLEFTREEEFTAARSRHEQFVEFTLGLDEDLTIRAIDLKILQNSGAYGSHSLTVMSVTASKSLALYKAPNVRVRADSVYTNLPPAGAYRGYGAPQGFFALESLMDEIADELGIDPLELRLKNYYKKGDKIAIAEVLGEGREGYPVILKTTGIRQCIKTGRKLIGWPNLKKSKNQGPVRRGLGVATVAQSSGIAGVDMGSASIKMNEDGSFNLHVGATDLGTGSDTALAQIAAEVLEVPLEKIIVYSADTDHTPFDTGAYASSTTYISGNAVKKAALKIRKIILEQGKKILGIEKAGIKNGFVTGEDGESLTYAEICTKSFYTDFQLQIQASASHMSYDSPPPFNATFADVSVDTETGFVTVHKIVSVTDGGRIINPQMAEGQAEGAIPQSLGFALSEFMVFDKFGRTINRDFENYHIFTAIDMPEIVVEFVHTNEPSGPFGAKAVAEIPIIGPAPAIANAIFKACGVRIRELPITPEKILKELRRNPRYPRFAPSGAGRNQNLEIRRQKPEVRKKKSK